MHKSDNIGPYGLRDRNESGDLLADLCVVNELVVSNNTFQQHPRRLYIVQLLGREPGFLV